MGYMLCIGVGMLIGYSSGRKAMMREVNAAGSMLRKMLTGKD
jgi:uncharacterized protein YneF (UPF0154 family)